MPRQALVSIENNFTKGLITEASGLTFPENSCTETINCVHKHTGNVLRRMGFEFEPNNSTKDIDKSEGVVNSYLWKDVAGNGNISLVVLQVKDKLYFYDGSTTDPLSSKPITDSIDLLDFLPEDSTLNPSFQDCQFTSGQGKLFVVHPYLEAFSVNFDTNTRTFTTTQINIEIRDFEGLDDGLAVDERPQVGMGAVSTEHKYNMFNQGWSVENLNKWDTARTDLPSNADIMWRFKNTSDAFDASTVPNVMQGNSPAPKGHYVLNVFNKDRGAAAGLNIPPVTTDNQRVSTAAFFAGRLFYSGINYVGLNSSIFFTQIIERDEQFGKCHQLNDPTSEDAFHLLPTDGGVIIIQEAGTIIKMVSVPGGLIVFASNGVWLISGSTGLGFTANDYSVAKISSIGALTHTSFLDLSGTPVWWNLEGIYQVTSNSGGFVVQSMSEGTIKTFYNSIPPSEKRNARGFYNPLASVAQWLYRSKESVSLDEFYEYDRVLNLDTNTGGFYIWTIPEHNVKIHGLVVLENRGGSVEIEDVLDKDENVVQDNDGEDVEIWIINNSIVLPKFKYILSYEDEGTKFTFGEVRNEGYQDWELSGDPVDYSSYFVSGYRVRGNAIKKFQSDYIALYSDNNSKYRIKGIWDYSNTGNSGRWSVPQNIDTTTDTHFDVSIRRRKIRGQGKVLQLRFDSIPNSAFNIIGWSMFVTANSEV